MASNRLPDSVIEFIVKCLACYDRPTEVQRRVLLEYGLNVSLSAVLNYDAARPGNTVRDKWFVLFHETRDAFKKQLVEDIPISTPQYRLRHLQTMFEKTADGKNVPLAAQLLEQAAKEAGGLFRNRTRIEHTGADGGPIKADVAHVDLTRLSPETLKELMNARFAPPAPVTDDNSDS